jgi:HD superfamily phosphodiesterase
VTTRSAARFGETRLEMNIIETHETIDGLLQEWRSDLGADHIAYRNHVYRVFNLSSRLACATGEDSEKLAVAAAFHDVGIWLDQTLDYLEPS